MPARLARSAAAVAGKAVLCMRGQNARVEKSKVVHDAGGVGMVLANTKPDEDIVTDLHWVPAVHVSAADGAAIRALLADGVAGHPLARAAGHRVAAPGDRMAAFSSRGPGPVRARHRQARPRRPGGEHPRRRHPHPGHRRPAGGDVPDHQRHVDGLAGGGRRRRPADPAPTGLVAGGHQVGPHDLGPGGGAGGGRARRRPARSTSARAASIPTGPPRPASWSTPRWPTTSATSRARRRTRCPTPPITALAAADLNLPSVAFSRFAVALDRAHLHQRRPAPQTWAARSRRRPGSSATVAPAVFDIAPGATQAVTLSLTLAGAPFDSYTAGAVVLTNTADRRSVRLPLSINQSRSTPCLASRSPRPWGPAPHRFPSGPGLPAPSTALGWGLAPPQPFTGQTVATAVPASASDVRSAKRSSCTRAWIARRPASEPSSCSSWSASRRAFARRRLPAPVLGRYAPARHDRHGA